MNLTPEEQKQYAEWVASRPPVIQDMIKAFPPTATYRLTTSGHIVVLYSYNEDGTFTVAVTKDRNPHITFERRVFGIKPEDLERIDQ